jgi:hypothetical protein
MTKPRSSLNLTEMGRLTRTGVEAQVASETRSSDGQSVQSMIPDLRGITLGQLAMQVADGEKDVTDVVQRIRGTLENSSSVPAMSFQSGI